MPLPLRAACDLVRLFQQVAMGQNEDAVAGLTDRRAGFRRHLSTRAGYGYALLAAAMDALGRRTEAATLWSDATALIRPDRLIEEFDLLQGVSRTYPATEHRI